MKKISIVAVVTMLAALGAVACGGDSKPAETGGAAPAASGAPAGGAAPAAAPAAEKK